MICIERSDEYVKKWFLDDTQKPLEGSFYFWDSPQKALFTIELTEPTEIFKNKIFSQKSI